MLPLISETSLSDVFCGLFNAGGLPFLVAITAIVVGGIMGIAKLVIRHRERMAMIERGMHPDLKREEPPETDVPREFHKS